jgi:hypothetical protein
MKIPMAFCLELEKKNSKIYMGSKNKTLNSQSQFEQEA